MPIINLQKRSRELGRIRLGQKGDRGQPQKLETFRFTSNSKPLLDKIASLYGGEVRDWVGGTQKFELLSSANRVPIMVPPQPVTQWHEVWRKSGIAHRCNGERDAITDELCDPEDPLHIEALEKPTTRLNVVLRDVEGIGVWRTESKGWHAAVELPDVAEFLAQAGGYVNGWLSLEQRTSIDNSGEKPVTRQFMVPIIEIDVTPSQLMAGKGRVAAPPMIGGPVGQMAALAAAGPDYVALAADLTDPESVRQLWRDANGAGHMTQGLSEHLQQRVVDIEAGQGGQSDVGGSASEPGVGASRDASSPPAPSAEPDAEGVVDAVLVEPDADIVWNQIQFVAGQNNIGLADLQDDIATFLGGTTAADATGSELQAYLDDLTAHPEEHQPRKAS